MYLDRDKYRNLMEKITLRDIETMISILEMYLEQSEKVEKILSRISRYERLYGDLRSDKDFMKMLFSMVMKGMGKEEAKEETREEAREISDEEVEKVLRKIKEEKEEE